jgi:hypothetical protein
MARNPRLQVVLNPETYTAIRELATLQGTSASSLVREIVEMAAPQLQQMSRILLQFQAQKEQIPKDIANAADRADKALDGFMELLQGQLDLAEYQMKFGALDAGSGAPPGDGDGGGGGISGDPNPPPLIGGLPKPELSIPPLPTTYTKLRNGVLK